MAFDAVLAERVRSRLGGRAAVTETAMFGGPAFLTGGHLTVAVHGDDLVVRVGPNATDAATARPDARAFTLTGRPMRGWVLVAGAHLDDARLDAWLAEAERFVATLPAG